MATTRFIDHLLEGDHASRPAAGDVPEGTLYSCTTHSLVYQSDTSTWSTWATLGGSSDLDAIIAASAGQDIADALSGAATPSAGNVFATIADVGGGTDPIAAVFGAPSTAFEFDTSSLAGLTAVGTPDAEDADTTIPDHYFVADNASGTAWCGRYVSIPSYSFTAMCKLSDFNQKATYNSAGLFVSVTTPGKMSFICTASGTDRKMDVEIFTNPTTYSSTPVTGPDSYIDAPMYLALVATSTSNVTYYYSIGGYIWTRLLSAHDPSMTIGSVGFAVKSENSGGVAAAFDWFRIWNSAKTFLTGI